MKRQIVIALVIMFVICIIGTTFAEARVGVYRPGVGVGPVGSGIGYRPGLGPGAIGPGLGRPGPGVRPGVGIPGVGVGAPGPGVRPGIGRPGIGVGAPGVGYYR